MEHTQWWTTVVKGNAWQQEATIKYVNDGVHIKGEIHDTNRTVIILNTGDVRL